MQIDVQTKSRSLLGVSDLTVVAPIKRGLLPALDSRSYVSRARLLMRTLNTLRISSREAEPTPLIADTVDQIRALQSFRLAIIEGPEGRWMMLLAVAFDGGWEPYMRRIWRDLGPLLDVIFCNCDNYPISVENDFATYANWVRASQATTEFFYTASSLTVNDLHYLRSAQAQRLKPKGAATTAAPLQPSAYRQEVFDQSLPALAALYRLTDMYPPAPISSDGACLLRAADYLLRALSDELKDAIFASWQLRQPALAASDRAAILWFRKARWPQAKRGVWVDGDAAKVQGGVLAPTQGVTHACLLLLEIEDAAAAKALLAHAQRQVISEAGQSNPGAASLFNIFFTPQGLLACGLPEATVALMPYEFREGMAARAGILGDYLHNHPSRWALPQRWGHAGERVELSSVHAVVELSVRARKGQGKELDWDGDATVAGHPLAGEIKAFSAAVGPGVRILSIETMQRYIRPGEKLPRGHFGYVDGISQPVPRPPAGAPQPWDRPMLGDFLLGHANSHGDVPQTGRLWDDSTFLVVRKLKQDAAAFEAALAKLGAGQAKDAKAQMMGRDDNGVNPVTNNDRNDFDYQNASAAQCPFHSHVRRANPRTVDPEGRPLPRIIRRGMSYGPLPHSGNQGTPRGLLFMAYNASIAEQFEVIQSWLNGNGSNREMSFSGERDPIVGVLNEGDPVGFEYTDASGNKQLMGIDPLKPFVTLEWGMYLFVPSIAALGELEAHAHEAAQLDASSTAEYKKKKEDRRTLRAAIDAHKGAAVIARLNLAEQVLGLEAARDQWKIALEDVTMRMSGVSRWIWAAVRELHGGVLRTPYGVLVCSSGKVREVFENRSGNYTATGYAGRMAKSFGEIYLGKDEGAQYQLESHKANRAIQDITRQEAFDSAFARTRLTLHQLAGGKGGVEKTVEAKDLVDAVLAGLCDEWFGLPDNIFVVAGGWHWRDGGPPTCPGHFHSPSRYMFQPNPGKEATDIGEAHGKLLNKAVHDWVAGHRRRGTVPLRTIAERLFEAIPDDDERLVRTLIGVLMGFLPTVDGNLRATLYEWVNDRSLWDHQLGYQAAAAGKPYDKAHAVLLPKLIRTLQLRPVPELTWRIALRNHRLGGVDVRAGETVAISIVSAMHECLANDDPDIYAVFGGKRERGTGISIPTHACPGYEMALGVLLGFFAALAEFADMRPTLSPMALKMRLR